MQSLQSEDSKDIHDKVKSTPKQLAAGGLVKDDTIDINSLFANLMLAMITVVMAMKIFGGNTDSISTFKIWIQKGDLGKPVELPYIQAMRIVRKHKNSGWAFSRVEPVSFKKDIEKVKIIAKKLSRWELVKLVFSFSR